MRRLAFALAALTLAAGCAGAPDVPPTVVLDISRVDDSPEGRARNLCLSAAQADGFDVLSISEVQSVDGGAGIEMMMSLSDRGARSDQRCIVSGTTVVFGTV